MAAAGKKLKKEPRKKLKTFYASLQVTRLEEWSVEAESADEARALLAQGRGERTRLGDCVHLEIQHLSE